MPNISQTTETEVRVRIEWDADEMPEVPTRHGERRVRRGEPQPEPRQASVAAVLLTYTHDGNEPSNFARRSGGAIGPWRVQWAATIHPHLKGGGRGQSVSVERYSFGTSPELQAIVADLLAKHEPSLP